MNGLYTNLFQLQLWCKNHQHRKIVLKKSPLYSQHIKETIVTAICLLLVMVCVGFIVILIIAPYEYLHWISHNQFVAIKISLSKSYRVNNPLNFECVKATFKSSLSCPVICCSALRTICNEKDNRMEESTMFRQKLITDYHYLRDKTRKSFSKWTGNIRWQIRTDHCCYIFSLHRPSQDKEIRSGGGVNRSPKKLLVTISLQHCSGLGVCDKGLLWLSM